VGNHNVVAGQRSLIVAVSTDHSADAAVSASSNDNDDDDKANETLPQAGTDTNGGE